MPVVPIDIHRDLVDACSRGEHSAYHQLYKLYSRAMYNAAFRVVNNSEEAEDILQEAFVSAFGKIKSFKGDSTFGAWLKKIVVNKAINQLRKKNPELVSMEDAAIELYHEEDENPEYNIESVKTAIYNLPDGYRIVLSLYLLEGYDHQEIAEILNISVSTSKSQLNRAKNKLRSMLNYKEVHYG